MKCCEKVNNQKSTRFKNAVLSDENQYYTVYLCYCKQCGKVSNTHSFVEKE
jgi:hypothetical protein